MNNRIVITGIGMVDTLGTNPDECFRNMISENYENPVNFETDIESLKRLKCFKTKIPEYNIPVGMRVPMHTALTDASKNAIHVVQQAIGNQDLGTHVGVVFSSLAAKSQTEAAPFVDKMRDGKKLSPRTAVQYLNDFTAGLISQTFDFRGPCVSMDAACATGLYSIDYAIWLLRHHCSHVIVGGTDTPAVNDDMYLFSQLGALGTESKPFDKNRDGFIMGEGAGCFLLELENTAIQRGAEILGYIYEVSNRTDGSLGSPTAPDADMTGAIYAMKRSLQLEVDIAFVNAHGTSTPLGDDLEYNAIQKVLPEVPVVSFKSKLGHTLAASAINESIYTLLCLQNGIIPANHNILECDHKYVYKYKMPTKCKFALKNSFGFGGKSSSMLIGVE